MVLSMGAVWKTPLDKCRLPSLKYGDLIRGLWITYLLIHTPVQ